LLELRRTTPALTKGSMTMLTANQDHVLSFSRTLGDETVHVAINFADTTEPCTFPGNVTQVLGTSGSRTGTFSHVVLKPNEAIVVR
jgi:glycosidase